MAGTALARQEAPWQSPLFHLSLWPLWQPPAGMVPRAGRWWPTADTMMLTPAVAPCGSRSGPHFPWGDGSAGHQPCREPPSHRPPDHGKHQPNHGAREERGKRANLLPSAPRAPRRSRGSSHRPAARLCPPAPDAAPVPGCATDRDTAAGTVPRGRPRLRRWHRGLERSGKLRPPR